MASQTLIEKIRVTPAFIFDMDGTVVDLEKLNLTAFQEVLGSKLTNKEFQEHISGRGSLDGLKEYLIESGGETARAEEYQEAYRNIKRDALQNRFDEVVSIMDGAVEFLAYLKNNNRKLCLATSTGIEFATEILEGTDLKKYFSIVLTRDDVRSIKPDPEIFELALERLDARKEDTIAFEDSKNGILAARNAGIFCVGIRNEGFNEDYVGLADEVIESYTELLPVTNPLS